MNNNNNNNNSSSSSSSSIFTTSTTTSRLWLLLVVVYLITGSRTIRNTHTTTKNHPTPTTIELKKTTQQKKTETTITTTDDEYYQPSEYQYIYHLWLITCETRTNSIDLENWFWSVNVFANTTTTTDSRSDTTTGTTHTHTHTHHHRHYYDVIVHEPRNICHGKQWKSFLETKIRSVYEFVSTLTTKNPIIINLDDPKKKQQQSQQSQQQSQQEQRQLQEEHLVMVIDDDVAINSFAVTPSDVIDRYYNILRESSRGGEETTYIKKKKIVIGAETNCFVGYDCKYEQLIKLYPNTTRSSCPQFANGGSYMGPPDMLQQMTYTFLFEYNFTNGDYYGKINDDQSMLHSYHRKSHNSQHPQLTTTVLDTKASLFRSLMVGLINSELYKPPRKGGRVCGGLDPTQHKTCAYNQPPIWDIITTNTTEDDDDNDTTTITTTIHNNNNMSSSLAKKKAMIQMYPHIPGCDYEIESVPFIIHGHGGSTYKKKVQEYVQRLQQQQQLQQQQK